MIMLKNLRIDDQSPVLHTELADGVLTLTLNRPRHATPLSPKLVTALTKR